MFMSRRVNLTTFSLIVWFICASPLGRAAEIGTAFTYQGFLESGSPPAPVEDTCDFRFGLWKDPSSVIPADQVGSLQSISGLSVEAGAFIATIDFGTSSIDGSARWLEIEVCCSSPCEPGGLVTLLPRVELKPAPHALALPGVYTIQESANTAGPITPPPKLVVRHVSGIASFLSLEAQIAEGDVGLQLKSGTDSIMTYDPLVQEAIFQAPSGVRAGSVKIDSSLASNVAGPGSTAELVVSGDELALKVDGDTVDRWTALGSTAFRATPNRVSGSPANTVTPGIYGVAISGGGSPTQANSASGIFSTIGGGRLNTATGQDCTVGGSFENLASGGETSTVAGGARNTASGAAATICGGAENTASGNTSSVVGGYLNVSSAQFSFIGGGSDNTASGYASVVNGGGNNVANGIAATVGGGGENTTSAEYATVSGGRYNVAGKLCVGGTDFQKGCQSDADCTSPDTCSTDTGDGATVSGGRVNTASGENSTVGGGYSNEARGFSSTIAGGYNNAATGTDSTVGGGAENSASGDSSFAAGRRAKADHNGAFVWGDSTNADVSSSAANQFTARISGGARFYSDSGLTTGVNLVAGGGSWTSISDKNLKENFAEIDKEALLERLSAIPVTSWNYKSQDPSIRHIGPMGQDFAAAFGVGDEPPSINTIDADGVALAAIQGIYEIVQEKDCEIGELIERDRRKDHRVGELEARNARLEARIARLEALLSTTLSKGEK